MKNKHRYSYLMSLGHFCSDINQGALSAILPFLIAAYHYNYTTAALLVMAANITGSIVQPVFGQLADKKNMPLLIGAGLFLAGGGMALTGFTHNFYLLCAAVIISGIGIAMFHPQAAKMVNKASEKDEKGKNISIFSFGGNLGFTCGPLLATTAITVYGLTGTLAFFIPAVIGLLSILIYVKPLKQLGKNSSSANKNEILTPKIDYWSAFYRLCTVIFSRSIIFYGFNTFLALYFIQRLQQTESTSTFLLAIFYAVGAISTLLGGHLADKYGYTKIVKWSFSALLPAILLFASIENLTLSVLLMLPISCLLSISYSPIVVLGQEYLPNHIGLSSGVTLGLAVSIGGIAVPLLGRIADLYSLTTVMYILAAIAVIPFLVAHYLPTVKE